LKKVSLKKNNKYTFFGDAMENDQPINKLMAKSRGTSSNYNVIFEDKDHMADIKKFMPSPDVSHLVEFSPEQKLEDNEWFYIDLNTDQKTVMIQPYLDAATSSDTSDAGSIDYEQIMTIFRVSGRKIIFSKITSGSRVENKLSLAFGERPELEKSFHAIELKHTPDAYFDGGVRLYFRNYTAVRPLFKGLDEFFRRATEEEREEFLGSGFFVLGDDYIHIGVRTAKRIAAIIDDPAIDLKDEETREKIRTYAKNYPESNIKLTDNGRMPINSSSDLNNVLTLLDGHFYTSELTGEKMKARGSAKLTKQPTGIRG
jgi:hypothetical protein